MSPEARHDFVDEFHFSWMRSAQIEFTVHFVMKSFVESTYPRHCGFSPEGRLLRDEVAWVVFESLTVKPWMPTSTDWSGALVDDAYITVNQVESVIGGKSLDDGPYNACVAVYVIRIQVREDGPAGLIEALIDRVGLAAVWLAHPIG